jgi:hypothetical protein
MTKKSSDEFSEQEAMARFKAALRSAMSLPHKPLKEKPKKNKSPKAAKKKPGR